MGVSFGLLWTYVTSHRKSLGVSLTDVGRTLEDDGVASFAKSFDDLLATLEAKSAELSGS